MEQIKVSAARCWIYTSSKLPVYGRHDTPGGEMKEQKGGWGGSCTCRLHHLQTDDCRSLTL